MNSPVTFEKSCFCSVILQLADANRAAINKLRRQSSNRRMNFLQIFRFAEFRALQLIIDIAEQSGENAPGAYFEKLRDAQRRQVLDDFGPSDRIGDLVQ